MMIIGLFVSLTPNLQCIGDKSVSCYLIGFLQVSIVIRDLSKRRPRRPRRNIFRTASTAPHADPDFRDGLRGSEKPDEILNWNDGVMTAAIAPAEHVYPFRFEVT